VCGIVGVVRLKPQNDVTLGKLIKTCLERLEYRGYDSVGFAVLKNGELVYRKKKGKIADVSPALRFEEFDGSIGVGHTRWATHGPPNDANAHPHMDCTRSIAVVHNGIIANYAKLKDELLALGHKFLSETDTEVFAHLFEQNIKTSQTCYEAFKKAVSQITGSYALVCICLKEPEKMFFARKNTPLVIGVSEEQIFVASDIPAFLEYTNRVIVINDNELGYVSTDGKIVIENLLTSQKVQPYSRLRLIPWTAELARKGGYPHYMIKEIHEQPIAIGDTVRYNANDSALSLAAELVNSARNLFLVGAGTAHYASLTGRDALALLARKPSIPVISSEFSLFSKTATESDVVLAVSQSGETHDTLMAIRSFKEKGAKVISICNVMESAIPRESHIQLYTKAGPEIGVAATKTFVSQVSLLQLLAMRVGLLNGSLKETEASEYIKKLDEIPVLVERNIALSEVRAKELARIFKNKQSAYYLSRGTGVPLAKEGALKVKEVAYIHAEAYEAGESKHGPISLVSEGFPVVFVFSDNEVFDQMRSNLVEMRSRGAYTVGLIGKERKAELAETLDYSFDLSASDSLLNTIAFAPTLQLIAYYLALERGYDPDKPRNLAKTVTVE